MLSWEQTPSIALMQRERAWVEIDLERLSHNVQTLKQILSPSTDLMAVVKADAYGHGAIPVARTALQSGATWLGVATIPEGIELREAGIQAPILILGATNTIDQVKAIARWQLEPTLCNVQQALIFSQALDRSEQILPVHIKLDTGMSRLGTPWHQAVQFVNHVHQMPSLKIASIYSHLATADDPDLTVMTLQKQRFEQAISDLRASGFTLPKLHFANSAAILTDPTLSHDLVRTGLALYGLYPAPHLQGKARLKPVLQVKARVTQVKTIPPGTGVSYGHRFVAERELQIATVGIGYADGVPRQLSDQMTVLFQGQRLPQIGAITMDQLMLDVSGIPSIQVGDVVTIIGEDKDNQISADDWAQMIGTISWEILCGFKHRLPRVIVGQSANIYETVSMRDRN